MGVDILEGERKQSGDFISANVWLNKSPTGAAQWAIVNGLQSIAYPKPDNTAS